MRLNDVLLVPWRSTHRPLRWLSLAIVTACMLGAIAVGHFMPGPRWWLGSTIAYCFGVAYAWAFWLCTALLLAIDARKLRLPGMQRAATCSVLLYGLLMLALPVFVLGALGANAPVVALLVALAMAGSLAFVLLPRWCAMVMGFLPALSVGLRYAAHLPPWSDPRWPAWGTLALIVLLVANVLRWRHLLRSDTDNELGFGSAIVTQFRRQGAMGNWNGLQQLDSGQLIRQRPDWMQPRANLRRTGPQSPMHTLRVALGGWYLPKTLTGHLRALAPILLPILLAIPVMAIMHAGEHRDHTAHIAMISAGLGLLGWLSLFGGLMLATMTTLLVRQRWQRTNAELPLLALLPGLGDAQGMRRDLLRSIFAIPFALQAVLLIVMLIAALAMHLKGLAVLLVALPQLAAAGAMVAQVLCALGGRKLPSWGEWLVHVPFVLLFFLSTFIPMATLGRHPWRGATLVEPWLLAAWVALALVVAWLGRRGWRGLLARPHPFLAD
ncbi:hypothetical protein ABQJ54_17875 [Rhodanobacter sp. Si-c]|uniref:ABC transporter permease n=1 Tax=Rhodanobacter lycopersici TaxID=3162487 RepID=A0ABV3QIM1_9GAMM